MYLSQLDQLDDFSFVVRKATFSGPPADALEVYEFQHIKEVLFFVFA